MPLPKPQFAFAVHNVAAVPPETQRLVVQDVNFHLKPGNGLDAEGEEALTRAMLAIRQRQGIVVVAHRPRALADVALVLAMSAGRQQAFGPKDEILAKVLQQAPDLKVVPTPAPNSASGSAVAS